MGYALYTYAMLKKPKEPTDIKRQMQAVKADLKSPEIDWDSFVVWAGSQNKLQQYLWREWKSALAPQGFTWQKLTKLLRHKTDRMVYWYRDMLPWGTLMTEIIDFVEGPYGQDLAKR